MADKEVKVVEAEKKPQKPKKVKKKGKIGDWWRGFKSEFKKIVWPSSKQVRKNTLVVLIIMVIAAIAIAVLDYAFFNGISALADVFHTHAH